MKHIMCFRGGQSAFAYNLQQVNNKPYQFFFNEESVEWLYFFISVAIFCIFVLKSSCAVELFGIGALLMATYLLCVLAMFPVTASLCDNGFLLLSQMLRTPIISLIYTGFNLFIFSTWFLSALFFFSPMKKTSWLLKPPIISLLLLYETQYKYTQTMVQSWWSRLPLVLGRS